VLAILLHEQLEVLLRTHSDVWMTLHRTLAANCMVQMRRDLTRQRLR
jgi:hypothetical protein